MFVNNTKDCQDQSGSSILVTNDVPVKDVLTKDVLTIFSEDVLKQFHLFLQLQNSKNVALALDMQTLSKGKSLTLLWGL
jgi:hypothetical protein